MTEPANQLTASVPVVAGATYRLSAVIRVGSGRGHLMAKSWRAGHREPRGKWRSLRSERLSRIRRAYRERRR